MYLSATCSGDDGFKSPTGAPDLWQCPSAMAPTGKSVGFYNSKGEMD